MKSGRSIPVPTIPARPSNFEGSNVKSSVISNGCLIEGMVENSIIGRGCEIRKGAVVRNCVVNADVVIGKDVHVENMSLTNMRN